MNEFTVEDIRDRLNRTKETKQKIPLLYELGAKIGMGDPQEGERVVRKGLRLAGAINDTRLVVIGLQHLSRYRSMRGENDAAMECLTEAASLLDDSAEHRELRCWIYCRTGCVHLARGEHQEALEALHCALSCADGMGDEQMAIILGPMADAYQRIGDYPKALELLARVQQIGEAFGSTEFVGRTPHMIGVIHMRMGNYDQGLNAFFQSLEIFREMGDVDAEAVVLGNIATAYSSMEQSDRALEYLRPALAMYRKLGAKAGEGAMIGIMADIYARRNELEAAMEYAMKGVAIFENEVNDKARLGEALLTAGRIAVQASHYEPALGFFRRALAVAEESRYKEMICDTHESLARLYELLEEPTLALNHYKHHMELIRELHGHRSQQAAASAQMRMQITIAEKDREIYRLHAAQLEQEMETKTQKLTAMALQLAQQGELIAKLEDALRPLAAMPAGNRNAPVTTAMRRIRENANGAMRWEMFEDQFRQVHPGFVQTLLQRYGTLTPTELKVCSLIKINLSTKEIAAVLCTSARTVGNHRFHIRIKLGLARDENLETFLVAIH